MSLIFIDAILNNTLPLIRFSCTKYSILIGMALLMINRIYAEPIRYECPIDDHIAVYYIEEPRTVESYPLIFLIEGSYCQKNGPQSVMRLHKIYADSFLKKGIGVLCMERRGAGRGADGSSIDVDSFHYYNTPSQRLADHIYLLKKLHQEPPPNWNGKLIILGGSEGGPLAVKLSYAVNPAACIILVGCGDQPFKEYIWETIKVTYKQSGWWQRLVLAWKYRLPSNRKEYEKLIATMKKNPDHRRWWFGQTYRYWADALEQTEAKEFLSLRCPMLVITGTEDIESASTDRLIEKVNHSEQDVTYLRIDGMGHDVMSPEWGVMDTLIAFIEKKI